MGLGTKMSEGNGRVQELIGSMAMAAFAGLVGIVTGIRVHGVKIEDLEKRLDRTDAENGKRFDKIDDSLRRIIERELGA